MFMVYSIFFPWRMCLHVHMFIVLLFLFHLSELGGHALGMSSLYLPLHAVLFSFCFCSCCMTAWCSENHQSLYFIMVHFIEFRSPSSTAEIMDPSVYYGSAKQLVPFPLYYYRKSCGAVEDLSCSRTACSIAYKNSEVNRIFALRGTMPRFRREVKETSLST